MYHLFTDARLPGNRSYRGGRIGGFSAIISLFVFAGCAHATEWKVCNASPETASVAIAFSLNDARQYITKGWWSIPPNGGCKIVFSGDLPISGVFLRGEGSRGGTWSGNNLFCSASSRFELPHANVDDRTCRSRGANLRGYQFHHITAAHYTTTLRGARSTSGFGGDYVGVPADQ